MPDASEAEPDAAPAPDAAGVDAAPLPDGPPVGNGAAHLLLTEVKTREGPAQFIEIANPLSVAIPLVDYYLSDDVLYARLPEQIRTGDELAVGNHDAIIKFPAGSSIAPGQVIVVAMEEAGFTNLFTTPPDYAVVPAVPSASTPMVILAQGVQSMELVVESEPVVLFRWDGTNDHVTDVDIVMTGDIEPAAGTDDALPNKSAIAVDGPDTDDEARQYATDAATMRVMSFRQGTDGSYKRIALEGDEELRGAGNGIDDHDETSEDTRATWSQDDSDPTPGQIPAGLFDPP